MEVEGNEEGGRESTGSYIACEMLLTSKDGDYSILSYASYSQAESENVICIFERKTSGTSMLESTV